MTAPGSKPSPALRFLPRVDDIMARLKAESPHTGGVLTQAAARQAIAEQRQRLLDGSEDGEVSEVREQVLQRARDILRSATYSTPRRVINGTGIIVHTGLGRSLLSRAASEAVTQVAVSHCALEVDVETGERGQRDTAVAALLRQITGCEDATVCNNCAGATLLALNTLAQGHEVICARGELVEIGGGFRMPEVMQQSGARLHEVGCTNKTRISDYADAINETSGALLKVHTSNYRVVGFTAEATLAELVQLGQERGLPVIEDLGSGVLVDLRPFGLQGEPRVQDSVATGADVVCFSGDKLLGGPQCGILCGRAETIARIRKNSLMRALRVDKFTLAALEATLRHYRDEAEAWREVPTLNAIATPLEAVKKRAQKLHRLLRDACGNPPTAQLQAVASTAQAGAGALPTQTLPSFAIATTPPHLSLEEFAHRLRISDPSIWGRIHEGAFWLDCRTLRDEELNECVGAIAQIYHG
ncbi:MAG: L-seryl-tRNA(Sec) selenium transferase [Abitibacteriaceae bacterium]|nr:L-seryl-tRNA(Sec) selenium transferase [Abditibacteriaceae bacterium]